MTDGFVGARDSRAELHLKRLPRHIRGGVRCVCRLMLVVVVIVALPHVPVGIEPDQVKVLRSDGASVVHRGCGQRVWTEGVNRLYAQPV